MERSKILDFAREHPGAIHGDAKSFVDLTEREVKRHAEARAWLYAKRLIEQHIAEFEHGAGLPASEAFVAKELCHEVARELRHAEPHVEDGTEDRIAGPKVMHEVESEALGIVRTFVHDLAEAAEHRAWGDIVHFTDKRGRGLEREHTVSNELTWDMSRHYAATAAKVLRILAQECAERARHVGETDEK